MLEEKLGEQGGLCSWDVHLYPSAVQNDNLHAALILVVLSEIPMFQPRNGFEWFSLGSPALTTSCNWPLLSCFCVDTKKDLRMITMRLLDMLVSKKVSGQGRDRALNLLNKNIPRKDLKDHDNSRTVFVIDNGESFCSTPVLVRELCILA